MTKMDSQSEKKTFFLLQRKWVIRIVSIVAFLIIWQSVGQNIDPLLGISTPIGVATSFVNLIENGQLPTQLASTMTTFGLGFLISVILGIPIGAAMARSKITENIIDPYVNALYATPYVALVPLFIIWLGIGFVSRLAVVILSVIFVIIINTFVGFKYVNKTLVETGRSFGLSGLPLYSKVILPATFPYIVAGLRLGIGRGLIGAIVAEMFLQLVGLGFLIKFYASLFQIGNVLAIVLTISVIGLALTEILKYVESNVSKWRVTATGG
ncbi:MAG: ABC transporter permease [Nitrososphaerales archaeon]